MSIFKTAIVGIGLLGKQHAKTVSSCDKLELTAICDLYESQMSSTKAEYPSVKTFTDYNVMFGACDIDLAIIATQDPYHKEPILSACKHGVKYIICEKPFAIFNDIAIPKIKLLNVIFLMFISILF